MSIIVPLALRKGSKRRNIEQVRSFTKFIKEDTSMRKLFCAVLILSVLLLTQIPSYAQRPAVDGFLGVPWGASKAQVQAAMAKKGFALLKQVSAEEDVYQGTFAGHPAELTFYYKKNVFYCGSAFLQPGGENVVESTYYEMVELCKAKYGRPDKMRDYMPGLIMAGTCVWKDMPATATPPGKVDIFIVGGKPGSRGEERLGVRVQFEIGMGWALLKTVNGKDF